MLFSNIAGDFFLSDELLLKRLIEETPNDNDAEYLLRKGFAFESKNDFYYNSFVSKLAEKKKINKSLSYIIVVPTLRCDLACSYCQVSRAALTAKGFDWSESTTNHFKDLLGSLKGSVKIEFQGGEPTLRLDLIEEIIDYCDTAEIITEFVICTNLNNLSTKLLNLLGRDDVYISTSIDGPPKVHTENRTNDDSITTTSLHNYHRVSKKFGASKINALPTITDISCESIRSIIDYYIEIEQKTIFLRPVNYQGFARKVFSEKRLEHNKWSENYIGALEYIFDLNFNSGVNVIEFGLEVALRRIFGSSFSSHVDLRSPNPSLKDYLVIDYDGSIFPSDEARMLSRINQVDLKMGQIGEGLETDKIREFNWNHMNEFHQDCIHCPYQPYCGIDNIDDISRYGRSDMQKHMTSFCITNMNLFDFIFSKLESADPIALYNFQGHLTGKFSSTMISSEWLYD